MRLNKIYLDGALRTLSERRKKNRQLEDARRSEVLEKLPEYGELEAELALTMTDVISSVLDKSGENDSDFALEKNRAIKKQMDELLEKNGYPADYLEPVYTCPKCKDTGNTCNEWCECLCRLTNEMAAAELNANAPLAKSRFDNFSLKCYSDKTTENSAASPLEIMKNNFEYCKRFTEEFDGKGSGILMIGGTGLGKTHLSLAIANVLIEKGFCVVYASVPELIRRIKSQFGKDNNDGEDDSTVSLATSCDLLILDDLGAENSTEWCVSMLYEIINTRQNRRLPIIVSTNLEPNVLRLKYQDRLSSRMFSMKILVFAGSDNRIEFSDNFNR